jgi:hypothetical protein
MAMRLKEQAASAAFFHVIFDENTVVPGIKYARSATIFIVFNTVFMYQQTPAL